MIAFEIVRRVDALEKFPAMGARLESRFAALAGCRQIVVRRKFRVIYHYDEIENCIYILAIQDCRQRLPSARDLKRREHEE